MHKDETIDLWLIQVPVSRCSGSVQRRYPYTVDASRSSTRCREHASDGGLRDCGRGGAHALQLMRRQHNRLAGSTKRHKRAPQPTAVKATCLHSIIGSILFRAYERKQKQHGLFTETDSPQDPNFFHEFNEIGFCGKRVYQWP